MRYKQNRGFCPQSKILSAQHKIAAKMQMKKKKTSERKNTQMSFIFHLFFLCLILSMTSCSVKSDYHFDNPHDALKQYRDFHHSIAAEPKANAEKLANFICQWQELSDTVYNYIKKDPAFTAHASLSMTFQVTSDSVRVELLRLASDCSLSDVAYVKMHTSPYRDDAKLNATKAKANTFFSALDKQSVYNKGNVREKISNLYIIKETCARRLNDTAGSLLPPRSTASIIKRNSSPSLKRKTVISALFSPI